MFQNRLKMVHITSYYFLIVIIAVSRQQLHRIKVLTSKTDHNLNIVLTG